MAHVDLPDFDTLAALYRQDPGAFEALRSSLLHQALDDVEAPRRQRIEALLNRIDLHRQRARNPLHAAVIAHEMMWTSFLALNYVLHHGERPPHAGATVLQFRPRVQLH
ncbi:DUF3135 domain-containing protein [Jeongeupia chitinilytica]|uniref:DUF3135 domain-containing protein n=1 Tax=Jeongeupia chitinilytica TaxID=1041641 RepID=A0ABQ3H2R3_9NEIS|nr:DUF3135 domain-containing protein [Jeongeupia chitinilytica]GHD67390.1 hypothetical protein GCM10007350_31000 [Jeongeupia chitinilytica]